MAPCVERGSWHYARPVKRECRSPGPVLDRRHGALGAVCTPGCNHSYTRAFMRSSSRVLSLGVLSAAAAALSFAGPASAAEPRLLPAKQSRVSLSEATERFCATRYVSGTGIAHRSYTAPADGFVTARLGGDAQSEWDLGVLDAKTRRALNGSAAFGALEVATATVRKGQAV